MNFKHFLEHHFYGTFWSVKIERAKPAMITSRIHGLVLFIFLEKFLIVFFDNTQRDRALELATSPAPSEGWSCGGCMAPQLLRHDNRRQVVDPDLIVVF